MRERLTSWLYFVLLIEGVILLTVLILFTLIRFIER